MLGWLKRKWTNWRDRKDLGPAPATVPSAPVAVRDLQDPLPESKWFWRRLTVFSVLAVCFYLEWKSLDQIKAPALMQPVAGITAYVTLGKWRIALEALVLVLYMVGANAEHIVKVLQFVSLFKSGVATSVAAQITPEGGSEAKVTTGPATPTPPPPPAEPAAPKVPRETEILE